MQVKRIGFGYTKSLGNYENCKVWLEADLEDWEDPSQSLNLLRSQVAQELDLPDKWHDLKGKFNKQLQALEAIDTAIAKSQEKLKKAQEEWEKYAAFLEAHGVDHESLSVKSPAGDLPKMLYEYCKQCVETNSFPNIVKTIQDILQKEYAKPEGINDSLAVEEGAADDDDSDYFDPYYGDEYDRLHNRVDDDKLENLYF